MSKRESNSKRSGQNVRGVQVFVALGLIIGLGFIIAAGWFGNSENRDTIDSAQLQTIPKPPSTTELR
jgi:hypothetical protein